jgi:hypothetical protein
MLWLLVSCSWKVVECKAESGRIDQGARVEVVQVQDKKTLIQVGMAASVIEVCCWNLITSQYAETR